MEILAFDRRLDRSSFSCGKPDLDDWLKTKAGQQDRTNNTRTFLAVVGSKVIGYYATTAYRLGLDEAAEMYGVGKRAYPIPAVLLARLAVDTGLRTCWLLSHPRPVDLVRPRDVQLSVARRRKRQSCLKPSPHVLTCG